MGDPNFSSFLFAFAGILWLQEKRQGIYPTLPFIASHLRRHKERAAYGFLDIAAYLTAVTDNKELFG